MIYITFLLRNTQKPRDAFLYKLSMHVLNHAIMVITIVLKLLEHVIFTVKCSYQQQMSVRHMLVKQASKGFGFFVHASEGFLL